MAATLARPGLTALRRGARRPLFAWWLGFPQAHGVVEVAGGGFVLFSVTGMSSLTNSNGVHLMMVQTENAAARLAHPTSLAEQVERLAQTAIRHADCHRTGIEAALAAVVDRDPG